MHLDFPIRPDFYHFGEDQSRIIISIDSRNWPRLLQIPRQFGVSCNTIGRVVSSRMSSVKNLINLTLDDFSEHYFNNFRARGRDALRMVGEYSRGDFYLAEL